MLRDMWYNTRSRLKPLNTRWLDYSLDAVITIVVGEAIGLLHVEESVLTLGGTEWNNMALFIMLFGEFRKGAIWNSYMYIHYALSGIHLYRLLQLLHCNGWSIVTDAPLLQLLHGYDCSIVTVAPMLQLLHCYSCSIVTVATLYLNLSLLLCYRLKQCWCYVALHSRLTCFEACLIISCSFVTVLLLLCCCFLVSLCTSELCMGIVKFNCFFSGVFM